MASLGFSVSPATVRLHPQPTLGFPSKPQFLPISTLNFSSTFRCISSRRLQINQKILTVSAINHNSSGEKSANEGLDVKETSNASQGPPIPTILAGLFVFFLVCWVIGSILFWLISLIVNVPPPK